MTLLNYDARGFSPGTVPGNGDLDVTPAALVHAATTVGAMPLSMRPGYARPLLERQWRTALVQANLIADTTTNRWKRSEAYSRLDPSEKSAVSYFLGMAQASVTMASLLSVTNLVHLDAIMAIRGIPSTASRPDFLGLDRHQNEIVAVEAKGRTRGRTADLTRRAKAQSRALPSVIGSSVTCVASIASFDSEGCWTAYLEDPPKNSKVASEYEAIGNLTTADLLVAYYLPIVATMFAAQADRGPSGDNFVVRIPAVDVDVSIPTGIADALGKQPLGEVSRASVADLGSVILRVLQSADERARGRDEVDDQQLFRGSDHVAVRLGRAWRR